MIEIKTWKAKWDKLNNKVIFFTWTSITYKGIQVVDCLEGLTDLPINRISLSD